MRLLLLLPCCSAFVAPSSLLLKGTSSAWSGRGNPEVALGNAADRHTHRSIKTLLHMSSSFGDDLAPPDEATLRKAYDSWRDYYGNKRSSSSTRQVSLEFNAERYQHFRANYIALKRANYKALQKAKQEGRTPPPPMQLNEYGDCSAEEYKQLTSSTPQAAQAAITPPLTPPPTSAPWAAPTPVSTFPPTTYVPPPTESAPTNYNLMDPSSSYQASTGGGGGSYTYQYVPGGGQQQQPQQQQPPSSSSYANELRKDVASTPKGANPSRTTGLEGYADRYSTSTGRAASAAADADKNTGWDLVGPPNDSMGRGMGGGGTVAGGTGGGYSYSASGGSGPSSSGGGGYSFSSTEGGFPNAGRGPRTNPGPPSSYMPPYGGTYNGYQPPPPPLASTPSNPEELDAVERARQRQANIPKRVFDEDEGPDDENVDNTWADYGVAKKPKHKLETPLTGAEPIVNGVHNGGSMGPVSGAPGAGYGNTSYNSGIGKVPGPPPTSASNSYTQERIRVAYQDWCNHHGKQYEERRLPIFQENYLAMEKYCQETNTPLKQLNQFADLSQDEYKQAKPPPKKKSDVPDWILQTPESAIESKEEFLTFGPRWGKEPPPGAEALLNKDAFDPVTGAKRDFQGEKRMRMAYQEWCNRHGKRFEETRLPAFTLNFVAMEQYCMTQNIPVRPLNEFADLTPQEYQAATAQQQQQQQHRQQGLSHDQTGSTPSYGSPNTFPPPNSNGVGAPPSYGDFFAGLPGMPPPTGFAGSASTPPPQSFGYGQGPPPPQQQQYPGSWQPPPQQQQQQYPGAWQPPPQQQQQYPGSWQPPPQQQQQQQQQQQPYPGTWQPPPPGYGAPMDSSMPFSNTGIGGTIPPVNIATGASYGNVAGSPNTIPTNVQSPSTPAKTEAQFKADAEARLKAFNEAKQKRNAAGEARLKRFSDLKKQAKLLAELKNMTVEEATRLVFANATVEFEGEEQEESGEPSTSTPVSLTAEEESILRALAAIKNASNGESNIVDTNETPPKADKAKTEAGVNTTTPVKASSTKHRAIVDLSAVLQIEKAAIGKDPPKEVDANVTASVEEDPDKPKARHRSDYRRPAPKDIKSSGKMVKDSSNKRLKTNATAVHTQTGAKSANLTATTGAKSANLTATTGAKSANSTATTGAKSANSTTATEAKAANSTTTTSKVKSKPADEEVDIIKKLEADVQQKTLEEAKLKAEMEAIQAKLKSFEEARKTAEKEAQERAADAAKLKADVQARKAASTEAKRPEPTAKPAVKLESKPDPQLKNGANTPPLTKTPTKTSPSNSGVKAQSTQANQSKTSPAKPSNNNGKADTGVKGQSIQADQSKTSPAKKIAPDIGDLMRNLFL